MTVKQQLLLYIRSNTKIDKVVRNGKTTTYHFSNGSTISKTGKDAVNFSRNYKSLMHKGTIFEASW